MRIDSHRLAGTFVAVGFLAGWFSASWVSPPTAVTQARPPRAVAALPDVPLPRIPLEAVTAPSTAPKSVRNPFIFAARGETVAEAMERRERAAADAATVVEAPTATSTESAAPAWRVFGIAVEADGRLTAVVSGGGDVWLLALDDRLPDGSVVAEIDAEGVVLSRADGERMTLRLP